jgi:hypothetical protein
LHRTPVATCLLQTNAVYSPKGEQQYQTIDFAGRASAQPPLTIPSAPPHPDTTLLCFLLSQSILSPYHLFLSTNRLRHRPTSRLSTLVQPQPCPEATTSTTIPTATSTTTTMITSTPMQEPTIWLYVALDQLKQTSAHNSPRMNSLLEP